MKRRHPRYPPTVTFYPTTTLFRARLLRDRNIVGERKSGPPATAVTKITSDPDGINRHLRRFVDHRRQCMRTPLRCALSIMHLASIRIGIEGVLELERSHSLDE